MKRTAFTQPHWLSTTVVAMFVLGIGATAADALSCDNCVDGTDIVNGSVQRADLNVSARSFQGASFLRREGGLTSTAAFDEVTIAVPAAGRLLVRVDGAAYLNLDANSAAAATGFGKIGLCNAPATLTSCGNAIFTLYGQDADDTDGNNETESFSLVRSLEVEPGPLTLYLNGYAAAGSIWLYGGEESNGAQVTATLTPFSLTLQSD